MASRRRCRLVVHLLDWRSMTDREFAALLLEHVVGDAVRFYREQITTELVREGGVLPPDPLWREVAILARSLTPAQRSIVIAFARQASIDAVSCILGVIDGTSFIPGAVEDFVLTYGDGERLTLSGDLQDCFLEAVELSEDTQ